VLSGPAKSDAGCLPCTSAVSWPCAAAKCRRAQAVFVAVHEACCGACCEACCEPCCEVSLVFCVFTLSAAGHHCLQCICYGRRRLRSTATTGCPDTGVSIAYKFVQHSTLTSQSQIAPRAYVTPVDFAHQIGSPRPSPLHQVLRK